MLCKLSIFLSVCGNVESEDGVIETHRCIILISTLSWHSVRLQKFQWW